MRDLGIMGESIFSLWCADAGLIPNRSEIDKTGWDFIVEFPYDLGTFSSPSEVHKAAFECKVQVKATDKQDRKLSITLSNLRRLATAQIPAFIVFIEFDGKETAQRAFVVHIDNKLISKILKRLHTIEQSDKENKFNKRTMTIHYGDSQMLSNADGKHLKDSFKFHIGQDIADYISNKKSHLETTGYESGHGKLTFSTAGIENFKDLIDSSLGFEKEVEISDITSRLTRFGIDSKIPILESNKGKIKVIGSNKPLTIGTVSFKKDSLSAGLTFNAELYSSPLNHTLPEHLVKMRVKGDFFDITFNPFTGEANYSYSFNDNIHLEVKKLLDAIKLIKFISSEEEHSIEFNFEGFPKLKYQTRGSNQDFELSNELKTLECADKIVSYYDVINLNASLADIMNYETEICQMYSLIYPSDELYRFEFRIVGDEFNTRNDTAIVMLAKAPIGNHIFGLILVFIGNSENISDNKYGFRTNNIVIEKKIVVEKSEASNIINDLNTEVEKVETKYENDYSVVTLRK